MSTDGWSERPARVLRADEGFDLGTVDTGATPGFDGDEDAGATLMAAHGKRLADLQEMLFAEGRTGGTRAVVLVLQGMDTSGKGGIVRHVLGMVDPQGVAVRSFGVPTPEERRHHYLWRVRRALPAPGRIGVFDRSHYEDVLVARVEGLVPGSPWHRRYAEINRFEQQTEAAGITVLKCALMISPGEQLARLGSRLERPDKHWKYDPSDLDARERWDDYMHAYQDVIDHTSTPAAPWYVIPADSKWYARLAVTQLLVDALEQMDLSWPSPGYDLAVERSRLAEAVDAHVARLQKAAPEPSPTERKRKKARKTEKSKKQAKVKKRAKAKGDKGDQKSTKAKKSTRAERAATKDKKGKRKKAGKRRKGARAHVGD